MFLRNTKHFQKVDLPDYSCRTCRSNHLAARTTFNSDRPPISERLPPSIKIISTWKGFGTLCAQCQRFYASETRGPDSWFFSGSRIGPGVPFACVDTQDEDGILMRRIAYSRINEENQVTHQSQIVSIIIRHDWPIGFCQLWLFDVPSSLARLLIEESITPGLKQTDPTNFWVVPALHVIIVEAIVKFHQLTERDYRDRFRRIDRNQLRDPLVLASSTRDALGVSDRLQASIDLVRSIREAYDRLSKHDLLFLNANDKEYSVLQKKLNAKLQDALSALAMLLAGSRANEHRVNLELQIAMLEANYAIALTNREDAEVMKTVAILGVIFLPATFIAALFSMSFFSTTDDGTWRMSSKFWVYWVVTIPVTALAGLTMWRWRFVKSKSSELTRLFQSYKKTHQE